MDLNILQMGCLKSLFFILFTFFKIYLFRLGLGLSDWSLRYAKSWKGENLSCLMMLITPSSPPPESRLIREPSHSHSADGATENSLKATVFSLSLLSYLLHSRPISSKEKRNHGSTIDKRTRKSVRQKRDGCRFVLNQFFLYLLGVWLCAHTFL